MTVDFVEQQVRQIVADVFDLPVGAIKFDSSPDTIPHWDSFHTVNLVLALEEHFGVQFTPEDMTQLLNVELIILHVQEKLTGK